MRISNLSLAELKKLQAQVEKAIAKKEKTDAQAAKKEVEKILAKRGLTLADIAATKTKKTAARPRKSTGKVAPKYANPKDKKVTWSGRGRTPLWVAAHIKAGGKVEDLAIKKAKK